MKLNPMSRQTRKTSVILYFLGWKVVHGFIPREGCDLSMWNVKHLSTDQVHFNEYTQLRMSQKSSEELKIKKGGNVLGRKTPLSAFSTIATPFANDFQNSISTMPRYNFDREGALAVVSSSLLITGNTVGAGTIVLPEVASGPGMLPSLELFFGIFLVNLISGLLIGEVAIKQYEQNEGTIKNTPSSFKDLADDLLTIDGIDVGQLVSVTSILINYCILSFALMRSGEVAVDLAQALNLAEYSNLSQTSLAVGFSVLAATLVSTQSRKTLSQIASGAVSLLFLSFGSILVPGLANMQQDIFTTISTPGTFVENPSESLLDTISSTAPIFVATMVYQNIVPTVTKLLSYDRSKVMTALMIGSAMPTLIYVAWCFAVLGGGVSLDSIGDAGLQSLPLLAFSIASIGGSSIACIMSLAEEFNSQSSNLSFIGKGTTDSAFSDKRADFSFPAVALAVVPPLGAGILFSNGEGMTTALELAGSYGSPLLYGILPTLLAWKQRAVFTEFVSKQKEMVPGGQFTQLALLSISTIFIGFEFLGSI